ncbi:hypothetical protein HYALB_00005635 [Hymenoscyphus albidus]|uniref:2EXR domain-containing protein n=1 Tax=Hymenoscyphus albidus TaxID=595503 RepID=A0A9N9LM50_9HELO|nr:hypothetical protein HYALB_00005635 [Hymenoscyphus albidus]
MDNHQQLFCERLAAYDQRRWCYLKQNIHRAREASGSIEVASPNAAKYERKFNRYIASSGLTGWTYTQETNLKTFPKFRRLPIELRWMIWRYALPGPRLLVVHECYNTDDWGNDPNCSCGVRILFSGLLHSPNPAILSVNRESRAVALKSYHLIFGSETVYADLAGGDMLYFYSTEPNDLLQCNIPQPPAGCPKCRDLQEVRHILFSSAAMDFYLMNEQQMAGNNSQSPAVATLKGDMGLFPNLKMVWFVGNDIYPMIDHEPGALVAELVEPEPAPIQWTNLPPRIMEWWQHS